LSSSNITIPFQIPNDACAVLSRKAPTSHGS
jgi:hypothetical protein